MSRSLSPWEGTYEEHGQLHIRTDRSLTPITLPVLPDAEEVEAWARRRRRKIALAGWLWVAMLVAVAAALMASGCGHAPAPTRPTVVTLPEREGAIAAQAVKALVGQEPKAATVGGVIVVFQPELAGDACLLAHEGRHQLDQRRMGTVAWLAEYKREYLQCRAHGDDSATCLRIIPLEAVAYAEQHRCQAERELSLDSMAAWPLAKGGAR